LLPRRAAPSPKSARPPARTAPSRPCVSRGPQPWMALAMARLAAESAGRKTMGWQMWKAAGVVAALLAPAAFADVVESTKETTGIEQLEVQLNAGGIGYSGELGGLTGTGPSYGVSAGGYLSRFFGAEVGYDGSVN